MKSCFNAFLFLLICLAAPQVHAESAYDRVMRTQTIRCGYAPWPMAFDVDPNTHAQSGFVKDMSDAVFAMLGWKVQYVEVVISDRMQDLNTGKIDAFCGDAPMVVTTLAQVDYSEPFYYGPIYLYARRDDNRFKTPDDLNNPAVKFAAIDSDLSSDLAQRDFATAGVVSLPATADASQLLLNVTTRKTDVTLIDPAGAAAFIAHNPGQIKRLFRQPVAVYGQGFSVAKGDIKLLTTLNGAVEMLQNNGAIDKILHRYDPTDQNFLRATPRYVAVP